MLFGKNNLVTEDATKRYVFHTKNGVKNLYWPKVPQIYVKIKAILAKLVWKFFQKKAQFLKKVLTIFDKKWYNTKMSKIKMKTTGKNTKSNFCVQFFFHQKNVFFIKFRNIQKFGTKFWWLRIFKFAFLFWPFRFMLECDQNYK